MIQKSGFVGILLHFTYTIRKPPRQTLRCLWTMLAAIKYFSNNDNNKSKIIITYMLNVMKVVDLMFQSQHNAYHAFHDTKF